MASVYVIMENDNHLWGNTPHSAYKGIGDSMRQCDILNALALENEEDKSYWVKELELNG